MKKYLAIDHGLSRIGLALGDDQVKIATPFCVVKNIDDIIETLNKEEIDEIVVGVPQAMLSNEADQEQVVLQFIEQLKTKTRLPIHQTDERFTTRMAEGVATNRKERKSSDAVAAMYILQSYLDSLESDIKSL